MRYRTTAHRLGYSVDRADDALVPLDEEIRYGSSIESALRRLPSAAWALLDPRPHYALRNLPIVWTHVFAAPRRGRIRFEIVAVKQPDRTRLALVMPDGGWAEHEDQELHIPRREFPTRRRIEQVLADPAFYWRVYQAGNTVEQCIADSGCLLPGVDQADPTCWSVDIEYESPARAIQVALRHQDMWDGKLCRWRGNLAMWVESLSPLQHVYHCSHVTRRSPTSRAWSAW